MISKLKALQDREDGFTLIELLIVVVIIGILAAIAIPIFLNQQKAAIAGTVKSDVRNTVSNVALYLTKNPTATAIPTYNATTAPNGVRVVASDANTIVIGSGALTFTGGNPVLAGAANWDNYKIAGSAPSLKGAYVFDSATGKYTTAADGAATNNDF